MQQILVSNDARQTFLTTLEGVSLRLNVWYQSVGEAWFIDVIQPDGTPITQGAKLNSGRSPLSGIISQLSGAIVPVPIELPIKDLGRNPWGSTHNLIYMTRDEARRAGIATI